jgi:hypothetical protein
VILDCKKYISVNQTISQRVNDENSSKDFCPKASEWLRVISDEGLLLVVVPKKEATFDHNRPINSFEHLKSDFENNIGEDDLSHLEEILQLHDLSLDYLPNRTIEAFKVRSVNNFQNRALHQHIFDMDLLQKIFCYFNLEVLESVTIQTDYIILGKKKKPT